MAPAQTGSLAALVAAMPFAASLGIELDAAAREQVRGRMSWDASRCTVGGVLHGGALITFADSLGAICAFLNLPAGAGTATIESKTNLFRAVRAGTVHGTCRPLHAGRSTIVVQTDLYDDGGRRVAQVTQTQSVLLPAPAGPAQ
jgi:1,4-dihydroxy-2-naphthoyl-CoA hydrolase